MSAPLPHADPPRKHSLSLLLLSLFLGFLFLSGVYFALPPGTGNSGTGGPPVTVETLVNVSSNATNETPPLLGVNVRADVYGGPALLNKAALPELHMFRWPGGDLSERYDMMGDNGLGTIYTNGVGAPAPWSTAQFVQWCGSIHCQAIFTVPAEIDNATYAATLVSYVEEGLGFHPTYWEIGNEPGLWTHFGIPWNDWTSSQQLAVSPSQYAGVVHAYIAAMRAVDPTIRIIGLGGAGSNSVSEDVWIQQTVDANGANLSAIAIHVYPAGAGYAGEGTAEIYGSLGSTQSLPSVVPKALKAIRSACATCNISLLVDEFNAATGTALDGFMSTYALVPYLAAEVMQGLTLNITSLDLWVLQGGYAGSLFTTTGNPRPTYAFFQYFLPSLGPAVHPVALQPALPYAYAVATQSFGANPEAVLMVANLNLTSAVELTLGGSGFPLSGSTTLTFWGGAASGPTTGTFASANGSWILPPDSIGLLSTPGTLT